MSRRKELLLSLLLSLASIVVCLLAAEVALRFLPVSTGLRSMPVNAENPVLHFTPDRPFTNSLGWNMHNVVHGRANNAGFVNDQDYMRDGPPLIAVVGDSFIEAQMVPYAESLQGRLAVALKKGLGDERVVEMPQKMTSEDFAEYGQAGVPSVLLHIGAVDPGKLAAARQTGVPVPAPHSPEWAPEREPTLKGAIRAEVTALLELFGGK